MKDYIVIDSDHYKESGIETMFFPGGEPHAKLSRTYNWKRILFFWKARNWVDVGLGICVLDALARSEAIEIVAFIPYFPAARQDKTDGFSPITVDIIASMMTRRPITRVVKVVFDIHSPRALESVGRWTKNLMPLDLKVPLRDNVVGIIAPDKGALERAASFRGAFYPYLPIVQGTKVRNQRTGELSGYELTPLPTKGHYIVVDDICDGGGTFNLLANAFDRDPLSSDSTLELFVSHGIFSRGLTAISPRYKYITTTDSWCQSRNTHPLTVLPLSPLFDTIMGAQRV